MSADAPPLPHDLASTERLLDLGQVKAIVPKSTSTIYRWVREGRFPPKYQIGGNSVVWRQSEVMDWIRKATNAS